MKQDESYKLWIAIVLAIIGLGSTLPLPLLNPEKTHIAKAWLILAGGWSGIVAGLSLLTGFIALMDYFDWALKRGTSKFICAFVAYTTFFFCTVGVVWINAHAADGYSEWQCLFTVWFILIGIGSFLAGAMFLWFDPAIYIKDEKQISR